MKLGLVEEAVLLSIKSGSQNLFQIKENLSLPMNIVSNVVGELIKVGKVKGTASDLSEISLTSNINEDECEEIKEAVQLCDMKMLSKKMLMTPFEKKIFKNHLSNLVEFLESIEDTPKTCDAKNMEFFMIGRANYQELLQNVVQSC